MPSRHSKLTAQGQISVPVEVRRELGVGPGSVLEWEREGNHFIVRRAGRYSSEDIHDTLFSTRGERPKTVAELKDGIRRKIRQRHARR